MNEKQLMKLKDEVDRAKSASAELRGRRDYLSKELDSKFGCKSIKQAEAKLKELGAEIAEIDEQLAEGIAKCEDMLQDGVQDR